MSNKPRHEHWGSQIGVVLAVAGSAVGLGNFLRFPGQVVNYGGGAFMIPYVVSLLLVAIPISMSEWALGRFAGRHGYHSPLGMYYVASGRRRGWGIVGGMSMCVPLVIDMYYIFVEAWCLFYAIKYLGGILEPIGLGFTLGAGDSAGMRLGSGEAYERFFVTTTGANQNGAVFSGSGFPLLATTIFCVVINFLLVYRGVSKGIEKFSKRVAPLILLCAIIMIVRVATLGNPTGQPGQSFLDGLGFMWNPSRDIYNATGQVVGRTNVWTSLLNPETWLAATSQIFYSVSICICAVCTYASYVRPKDDIALSSLSATATNEFCEVVLGGLMAIPPAIMFLGTRAADGFSSSFQLGFIVLPNVFELMPLGQLCGFVFFFLLFSASVTSSMSLVLPAVAFFREALQWSRGASVLLAASFHLVGALIVIWFTKGLTSLDTFDFWFANFAPFFFAIMQTGLAAFVWGSAKMKEEISLGSKIKPPTFLAFVVKYLSFPYLLVIAIFWTAKNLKGRIEATMGDHVAQLSIAFFLVLLAFLFALSVITIKRWRAQNSGDGLEKERQADVSQP